MAGLVAASACTVKRLSLGAPPKVSPSTKNVCERVHRDLPQQLDTLDRRSTVDPTSYAVAWGDPPVVLYCGFARAGWYDPSNLVRVNGVDWSQHRSGSLVQWGTLLGRVFLELDVPTKYDAQASFLVGLARPLINAGRVGDAAPSG